VRNSTSTGTAVGGDLIVETLGWRGVFNRTRPD
jgi:hypothetical protein